ncbi:MAG: peptide MFS transporter [Steroidobacteraceae bacterium]
MSAATWFGHPRGLATLYFTEMWERFSYYGMRAILVLAMVAAVDQGGMGLNDRSATAIYGLYTASVYMFTLAGGWVADRLLGQRAAVWYGGILISCGHFTMALPWTETFFIGLVLIVLGTGLLKPNISAMVGDLYVGDSGARRDAGFSIFYMGINLGAFVGQLICGYLGERVGWHYGFAAAGFFMVLGLIQYRVTGHYLGNAGLPLVNTAESALRQRRYDWRIVKIAMAALFAALLMMTVGGLRVDPLLLAQSAGVLIVAVSLAYFAYVLLWGGLNSEERKRVGAIIVLFVAAALFWSGFEQAGSSFNLFAERYTDRVMFGWEVPASWLQSINPFFIVTLAPVFAALWVRLGMRGLEPSTPIKMALGLLQMALGFLVLYFAAQFVVQGRQVAPTWLLLTYLLHTTGELCLSPVGLSAVTKLSPPRYVGQMMGVWFMGAALGNLIAGLIAGHFGEDSLANMPERLFSIFTFGAVAALVLLLASRGVRWLMAGVK